MDAIGAKMSGIRTQPFLLKDLFFTHIGALMWYGDDGKEKMKFLKREKKVFKGQRWIGLGKRKSRVIRDCVSRWSKVIQPPGATTWMRRRRRRRSWNNIRRAPKPYDDDDERTLCVISKRFPNQMGWKSAANWRGDVAQPRQLASQFVASTIHTLRTTVRRHQQNTVRNSPRWRTEVIVSFLALKPSGFTSPYRFVTSPASYVRGMSGLPLFSQSG